QAAGKSGDNLHTKFSDGAIRNTIGESGYLPDNIRCKEIWLGLRDPLDILKQYKVDVTELATSSKPAPKVGENFQAFTEQNAFKTCAALGEKGRLTTQGEDGKKEEGAPTPFCRVLSGATADLIRGLASYTSKQGGVDKVFEDKGLGDLLQTAYAR